MLTQKSLLLSVTAWCKMLSCLRYAFAQPPLFRLIIERESTSVSDRAYGTDSQRIHNGITTEVEGEWLECEPPTPITQFPSAKLLRDSHSTKILCEEMLILAFLKESPDGQWVEKIFL